MQEIECDCETSGVVVSSAIWVVTVVVSAGLGRTVWWWSWLVVCGSILIGREINVSSAILMFESLAAFWLLLVWLPSVWYALRLLWSFISSTWCQWSGRICVTMDDLILRIRIWQCMRCFRISVLTRRGFTVLNCIWCGLIQFRWVWWARSMIGWHFRWCLIIDDVIELWFRFDDNKIAGFGFTNLNAAAQAGCRV